MRLPQVSDLGEPYRSRVRDRLAGRTEELERLAVEMYARRLSTRDIESTFADEQRRSRPATSRSTTFFTCSSTASRTEDPRTQFGAGRVPHYGTERRLVRR
jgi:hypothetical protein